jgi:hypothetical protein
MNLMKKFCSGLLVGILIMSSIIVFAESIETVQVIFGRVRLVIDGNVLSEETLLYNGTTYIPLRAAAEALGVEVAWDGTTNTASLISNSSNQVQIPLAMPLPTPEPVFEAVIPTPEPLPIQSNPISERLPNGVYTKASGGANAIFNYDHFMIFGDEFRVYNVVTERTSLQGTWQEAGIYTYELFENELVLKTGNTTLSYSYSTRTDLRGPIFGGSQYFIRGDSDKMMERLLFGTPWP